MTNKALSKKTLQTAVLAGSLLLSINAHAGLMVNEQDDFGDFDKANPVLLTLEEGTNTVRGVAINFDGRGVDYDSFMFEILQGFTLKSILFSAFAEAPTDSTMSASYQLVKASKAGLAEEVISESNANLLSWSKQQLFTDIADLGAGIYGFHTSEYQKNFEGRRWNYSLQFEVAATSNPAPVSAPGPLALMFGFAALLLKRRRKV